MPGGAASRPVVLESPVAVGAGIAVVGAVVIAVGFWLRRRMMLFAGTPTSKVRSMAMGEVELKGVAEPDPPPDGRLLTAPFTGRDCFYFEVHVEERVTTTDSEGRTRRRWVTRHREDARVPFMLRDETAAALVDPDGAKVDVPADFRERSRMGKDPPPEVVDYLRGQGVSFEGLLGINKDMRYTERSLLPGERLYVFGWAGDNPRVEEATAVRGVEDVMVQKGDGPFVITDRSEEQLVGRLRWGSWAAIVVGGLLVVAGVAVAVGPFGGNA